MLPLPEPPVPSECSVDREQSSFLTDGQSDRTDPRVQPCVTQTAPAPRTAAPCWFFLFADVINCLSSQAGRAIEQIRASSPALLRQILPLLEQLPPLAAELADGKDEFTPAPEETKKLVRAYYGVGRNLLVQFDRDSIDETPELAQTLGDGAACTPFLDMQVRTLTGDHARPLQQVRGSRGTHCVVV
jgi:hypothetical protein